MKTALAGEGAEAVESATVTRPAMASFITIRYHTPARSRILR